MTYDPLNSHHNLPDIKSHLIQSLLQRAKSAKSKNITVGHIYDIATENDGYPVLIASLAVVLILPVGALPGVPAIVGIVMSVLYLGIIVSSQSANLPKSISNIKVKPKIILKVCNFLNQCLKRVNEYSKENRLQSFNGAFSSRIVAALGFIFSIATILIGFIPFVPTLLMIPILLFSLGGILKDGLFTFMGYIFVSIVLTSAALAFV